MRSFEVENPVRDRTEHRDDMASTGNRRQHDSIGTNLARLAIADF